MVLIELAEDECRVAVFDVFVFVFVSNFNSLKFMLFKKVLKNKEQIRTRSVNGVSEKLEPKVETMFKQYCDTSP